MGKFENSFSKCDTSCHGNMKEEDTKETKFSSTGGEQSYGSSLYAILLDDKLCTNKYLRKLNPLNQKVKKFFNNSRKTSSGQFHTPTKNAKSENDTSCCKNTSTKNSSSKVPEPLDDNTSLNRLDSQVLHSTSTSTISENIKKKAQKSPIDINQSTQTDDDSNLSYFSLKSIDVKKNQLIVPENISLTELDPEIDNFLRTYGGHSPTLQPTKVNDIEKLEHSPILSPPLKKIKFRMYLSPNFNYEQQTDDIQFFSHPQLNEEDESKNYYSSTPPLTTLYEEEDVEDDNHTKMCSEKFSYSMNVKSMIPSTPYKGFGKSMNITELRNLKSKPMIDIPKKISNCVLKNYFDRNAERRAYIIRSEERKSSKGWTNVNRYCNRKVKPIPSGCWVQGKDDDKILANNGSLNVVTIAIVNCPHVEEFNLGIHLEDILLENFILISGKGYFDFYTRDDTIFNEFLNHLFKNSKGLKLPYIDEIVKFVIAI